jgi:hypothetical protein
MKVKGVNIPWMTAELSQAMQQRDHHLKKAQKNQSKIHWSAYRKYRCFVNKKVRECKSQYYENLIKENKNNPSGLWKTLHELTSPNIKSSSPRSIITDGVEHKHTKFMSSPINRFFTSIGITLANEIKQKYKNVRNPSLPEIHHLQSIQPSNSKRFKLRLFSRIYQN